MPIITNLKKESNNGNKKSKMPSSKVAGIILLAIGTIGYLGLFIKWIPFLHNFFLGTFGLFSYVLFLLLYIIGGALFKGNKYVFAKRYIVFLSLALVSILSIFHIAFTFTIDLSSYGGYLSSIYNGGVSVGGALLGLIIYPLQKLLFPIGALFLFLIILAISIWLIYDYLTRVRFIKKVDTKAFNRKTSKILDKSSSQNVEIKINEKNNQFKIGLDAQIDEEENARNNAMQKLGLNQSVRNERFVQKESLDNFASDFLNTQKDENYYNQNTNYNNPNYYNYDPLKNENSAYNSLKQSREVSQDYSGTFGYNVINSTKSKKQKSSNYDKNREFLEATLKGTNYVAPKEHNDNEYQIIDNHSSNKNVSMEDFLNVNFGDSKSAEQLMKSKSQNDIVSNNDYSSSYSNINSNPIYSNEKSNLQDENIENHNDFEKQSENQTHLENSNQNSFNNYNQSMNFNRTESENNQVEQSQSNINENKSNEIVNDEIDLTKFELPESLKPKLETRRNRTLKRNENQANLFTNNLDTHEEEKPHIFEKYIYPTTDLLNKVNGDATTYNENCEENARAIEQTLENFGIPAKVINTTVGPSVTRYELNMPAGISVNNVSKYANDITAAVSAIKTVRIQAPIPGKSAVGIEVPNLKVAMVGIREILESEEFLVNKNVLSFAVGKEVSGKAVVADMHEMPHMLVAGSTGSGKSVALNTIIVSLIYKYGPEDLRFLFVDPKQVEFYLYNGLPHLLLPEAITDATKALSALDWAIAEMERRYTILRDNCVRDIMEYNDLPEVKSKKKEKMSHIVIIIDEVGDIMTLNNVKKDFEEKVRRLTQKARSAGINLILATQRPSVDVITGVIKANLPSRMAFAVMNYQDSKTILDTGGADKLLGKGDMLFSSKGKEPFRVQGCFVSTREIQNVVSFIKQNNQSYYDEKIAEAINKDTSSPSSGGQEYGISDNSGYDPLMKECLKLVIKNGCASTSMLQRRFSIGQPKAARIIDQMEQLQYVGPLNGSKPRAVYLTPEKFKEIFGEDIDE